MSIVFRTAFLGSVSGRTEFLRILFLSRRISSRILSPDLFSSFLWEKLPRKILHEIPQQNPPKFVQQKSPTTFCRGAGPSFLFFFRINICHHYCHVSSRPLTLHLLWRNQVQAELQLPVQEYMSKGIFYANKAKTGVRHFCLKHYKTRHTLVKRDSVLKAVNGEIVLR